MILKLAFIIKLLVCTYYHRKQPIVTFGNSIVDKEYDPDKTLTARASG